MKILKKAGLCLSVFMLAASLTACGGSADSASSGDLYGTWILKEENSGDGWRTPDEQGDLILEKGGKGTLHLHAFEMNVTDWKVDGETFTAVYQWMGDDHDLNGTLKNGVIEAGGEDGTYRFAKEGTSYTAAAVRTEESLSGKYLPYAADYAGIRMSYSDLVDADMADGTWLTISEDETSGEMGADGETMSISINWDSGTITMEDDTVYGIAKQDDGSLALDITYGDENVSAGEGLMMYFAKEGDAFEQAKQESESDSTFGNLINDTEEDELLSWWNGEWYGWWIIRTAYGSIEYMKGSWWDACAIIDIKDDYTGTVILWDEDSSMEEPIGEVQVTLSEYGTGEHGTLYSESGYFMDHQIEHADWISDPNVDVDKDNMILFEGEAETEDGSYTYQINLRPWGTKWDDMDEKDLPYNYSSWYLPLIEAGKTMPDRIGADLDTAASEEPHADAQQPLLETPDSSDNASSQPAGAGIMDRQALIDAYNSISDRDDNFDLTYEQVVKIFGTEGELNQKESSDEKHYYCWYGKDSNVIVKMMFRNRDGIFKLSSFSITGDH